MRPLSFFPLLVLASTLCACSGGGDAHAPSASAPALAAAPQQAVASLPADEVGTPLSEGWRTHAGHVDIGIQVGGEELFYTPGDGALLPVVAREASVLLIGNNLKWAGTSGPDAAVLRPSRDTFDFRSADVLVDWAEHNGMKIRAHVLVWGEDVPAWLANGSFTRDELLQILHEHIATVVGRYKGRIRAWDVVNEAFDWNGEYKDTFWLRKLGPEYIEIAFRWAHEADPAALLFLNEDGTEALGAGSDRFLQQVQALLAKGTPIHGVGLETHVDLEYRTLGGNTVADPVSLAANIRRLGALGLQVSLSEVDVRIPLPATAQGLATQAAVYAALYDACASEAACTGFHLWGITDKWSWIPRTFEGLGAALPLDQAYAPKPAYSAVLQALRANTDRCLDWGARQYAGIVRPATAPSAVFDGYYYRHFTETGNYAGVRDGMLYYWDPADMAGPLAVMSLADCQQAARAVP